MNNIDMRPFENYSWLRHSAKCQMVQPGWKYSADSATLPLEKLAAAWAGVQQFMRDENFRIEHSFACMLERETLEEALKKAPSQMMGIRLEGGTCTAYSMGTMKEASTPIRGIYISPDDIRDTAVQILALLACGIASRVEIYRGLPDGLSEKKIDVIHNLFDRLANAFRKVGFAVNLHAVEKEQIREGIQGFGPEFPSRHFVKLNRKSSSTSNSPTDKNPVLMWVNASYEKVINGVQANSDYCFYCVSPEDSIEAIYSIPAQEMFQYLNARCKYHTRKRKWFFYIDFKKGRICASVNGDCPHPLNVVLKSQF